MAALKSRGINSFKSHALKNNCNAPCISSIVDIVRNRFLFQKSIAMDLQIKVGQKLRVRKKMTEIFRMRPVNR